MDNQQIMKFQITNDKLKMEIKISDLVWLFHNSPNNINPYGIKESCKIKRGKERDFTKWVVEMLQDESTGNDETMCWGLPFEEVFDLIFEGHETCDEFCDYVEDETEDK